MKKITKSASLSHLFLIILLGAIGGCGYMCIDTLKAEQETGAKAATEAAWFTNVDAATRQVDLAILDEKINFRQVLIVQDDAGALNAQTVKLQSTVATTNAAVTALKKTLESKKIPAAVEKLAAANTEMASKYQAVLNDGAKNMAALGAVYDVETKASRAAAAVMADVQKAASLADAQNKKVTSQTLPKLASYMWATAFVALLLSLLTGSLVTAVRRSAEAVLNAVAVRSANLVGAMAALRDAETEEDMAGALASLKEGVDNLAAEVNRYHA